MFFTSLVITTTRESAIKPLHYHNFTITEKNVHFSTMATPAWCRQLRDLTTYWEWTPFSSRPPSYSCALPGWSCSLDSFVKIVVFYLFCSHDFLDLGWGMCRFLIQPIVYLPHVHNIYGRTSFLFVLQITDYRVHLTRHSHSQSGLGTLKVELGKQFLYTLLLYL